MLKVAIANDSAIAIEALRYVLSTTPDYQLSWVAKTGADAVHQCAIDCPDLILMDMHMPELDGVEATRQILQRHTCAILIVTATIKSHSTKVFEALSCGALDVVKPPSLGDRDPQAAQLFLKKLATLTRFRQKPISISTAKRQPPIIPSRRATDDRPQLIVIGASTGGPRALQTILSQLPKHLQAALVVVQHIDAQFVPGLVQWLNQSSALPVAMANNGDIPEAGKVLIASRNEHLQLRPNHRLRYTYEPADHLYRPSIDVFFKSVAEHWQTPGIAVLLTGMGQDGAQGMGQLRAQQWHTIAESADSCAVFGMPKAAIQQGAARQVLSLEEIIPRLSRTVAC